MPYIYNWLFTRIYTAKPISNEELILHLKQDTVKNFKVFIDSHIDEKKQAKAKLNAQDKKQIKEEQVFPALTNEQKIICQEVARGRFIYFLNGDPDDPHFAPSVKRAIYVYLLERNKRYIASNFDMLDYAAENGFLPFDFVRQVKAVFHFPIYSNLQLEDLREIMVKECKTLNQLRLAQAIIVHRFIKDPYVGDVFCYKVGLTPQGAARKYLGLDESMFKSLQRISESLEYIPRLQKIGIDPLANGCLDKLANLNRALKKNSTDETLSAFKKCNVKEFRHFAKTGLLPDSIASDNKLLLKGYKRAIPYLEELDKMRNKGLIVYPVSLYCRDDVKLVEKIISEYRNNREEAIKEIMFPSPSVPMLRDMTNPQQSDSFEVDIFC